MAYFKPKDNYFEITQAFLAFCKIISAWENSVSTLHNMIHHVVS